MASGGPGEGERGTGGGPGRTRRRPHRQRAGPGRAEARSGGESGGAGGEVSAVLVPVPVLVPAPVPLPAAARCGAEWSGQSGHGGAAVRGCGRASGERRGRERCSGSPGNAGARELWAGALWVRAAGQCAGAPGVAGGSAGSTAGEDGAPRAGTCRGPDCEREASAGYGPGGCG